MPRIKVDLSNRVTIVTGAAQGLGRAIAVALLSREERAWIDAYHATVFRKLRGRLSGADLAWLQRMTRPL